MYTVDASVWVIAFDQREPGHLVSRQFLLIAAIHFNRRKVYIRHVLPRQEYDRGAWKTWP